MWIAIASIIGFVCGALVTSFTRARTRSAKMPPEIEPIAQQAECYPWRLPSAREIEYIRDKTKHQNSKVSDLSILVLDLLGQIEESKQQDGAKR